VSLFTFCWIVLLHTSTTMTNIYSDMWRLLNDNINNYVQKLLLLQIKKERTKDVMEAIDQPFMDFLHNQILAYKGKWSDLEKFIQQNSQVIQQFQEEFDTLKQEVLDGEEIKPREFADRWTDEEKRKNTYL